MRHDYTRQALTAQRLIDKFGASCRLIRHTESSDDPITGAVLPGRTDNHEVRAVVVEYEQRLIDGATIQRGDRQALIDGRAAPRDTDVFVDVSGVEWAVVDVQTVQPAATPLLHILQLRR